MMCKLWEPMRVEQCIFLRKKECGKMGALAEISILVIKSMTKINLGRKGFPLTCRLCSIFWGSQGWIQDRSTEAGTDS